MKKEEKKDKGAVPFFARYLEDQDSLRVRTNLKAGKKKDKCDGDGGGDDGGGIVVTLKYPSDAEDTAI